MNVRLFFLGLFLALLAGCASTDAPGSASDSARSIPVDQTAPVTGGALFNGN